MFQVEDIPIDVLKSSSAYNSNQGTNQYMSNALRMSCIIVLYSGS